MASATPNPSALAAPAAGAAGADAWQDFGQKVDLTARIREILLNYPEGTSILKELVQNADDARASCIKLCLDRRHHATGSLLAPTLAAFQGASLLVYNDGVFSERDFESISRIGDSKKKEEVGKTGRFGVGFNSCYHLTDLPTFVSGQHLVMFDPHCTHLPNISATNPGKKINFVQHPAVAAEFADQFAPFEGAFGCAVFSGQPWPATLFRFPLRGAELASRSTISKQVYTPEAVSALLAQLAAEAHEIMLFLKHISRIEVLDWEQGQPQPRLRFSCAVANPSQELALARGLFARVSGEVAPEGGQLEQLVSSYRLELVSEHHHGGLVGGGGGGSAAGGIGVAAAAAPAAQGPVRRAFLITQVRGGGEVAAVAAAMARHFSVPVVPWGAVAADVTPLADGERRRQHRGRAFCFLPLPAVTGLPVHVNGYFELSSNRRDIWYGEDMSGSGAKRAHWNMLLLDRVIAPAYAHALHEAARTLGHGPAYDALWPAADVAQPWHTLLVALYQLIAPLELCWTPAQGGRWVAPQEGIVRDTACSTSSSSGDVEAAEAPLAAALMAASGMPLMSLAPGVAELMARHTAPKPRVASPALARQALGADASPCRALSAEALRPHLPPLLVYCLSDLQPQGHAQQAAAALAGLRLLPLADGQVVVFAASKGHQHNQQHDGGRRHHAPAAQQPPCYYLPTDEERHLLQRLGGLLVDTRDLGDHVLAQLLAVAGSGALNIASVDAHAMADVLLPRVLPQEWLAGGAAGRGGHHGGSKGSVAPRRLVGWRDDPLAQAAGIDREWLQRLWRWLQALHAPLTPFVGLPLLPIEGGRLAALPELTASAALLPPGHAAGHHAPAQAAAPARADAAGLAPQEGAGPGPPLQPVLQQPRQQQQQQLTEILTQLGLQLVDTDNFTLPVPALLRSHVHRCDGPGVLSALHALVSGRQQQPPAARADSISSGGSISGSSGLWTPAAAGASSVAVEAAGGGRSAHNASAAAVLAARVSALPAEDKRVLRALLVTEPCLQALHKGHQQQQQQHPGSAAGDGATSRVHIHEPRALLQLLSSLPIYESARSQTGPPPAPAFTALTGTCYLAPAGVDPRVLGALSGGFVVAASESEGRLLVQYLGVKGPSAAEVYRSHVLPALGALPPALRDSAVRGLLLALPQLGAQDRGLAALLRQTAFVPNNKGELCKPGDLYDPRNADLAALLDPETAFPATSLLEAPPAPAPTPAPNERPATAGPPAAGVAPAEGAAATTAGAGIGAAAATADDGVGGGGAGSGAAATAAAAAAAAAAAPEGHAALVLSMLQHLGLRSTATPDTLLAAARFVERLAFGGAVGSGAAAAAAGSGTGTAGEAAAAADDLDMAVARGKALLAYLEVEAGRIAGPAAVPMHAAGMATSKAAGAGGPGGGGGGGGGLRFAAGLLSKAKELLSAGVGGDSSAQQLASSAAQGEVTSFWQELARIRWCPTLPLDAPAPAPGLPWPPAALSAAAAAGAAAARLAAPRYLRPPGDMWLCSACLGVLDGECRSSALAAGLGWAAPLGGSVLAQQLIRLGEAHARVSDPSTGQALAAVVPQLYRALLGLSPDEGQVARGLLYGSRCVWVGNGFATASKVAFKGSLDLSPWLYVTPAELAPFKELLLGFGATESFSAEQYCSVLADVAAATGAAPAPSPPPQAPPSAPVTAAATPLSPHQLSQVVAVAQALADMDLQQPARGGGSGTTAATASASAAPLVYLPDERGVLALAGELAYNDAPWLAGQPSAAAVRLVHPRISAHVAARLGVPSLRRLLLAASSDSVALAAVGAAGAAEAFGQSEALTTRLRHIISDYPEGPGVLMELMQNADDAGASTLTLLLDCHSYPTNSILGPAMAAWQGPALLAYNDALFSPSDFHNISRIGQDTKAAKPNAIGRFGLGFNAVYHFTDLPCFVSGDYLVMFDPHAKYLPGVSPAQPGLKVAFLRAQLLDQFPDAFTPFAQLGCTLREHFRGTLFRFPLRTPAAAASSDIKSTPCSPSDVMALLGSFREQLPAALLFLKSLRCVSVYVRGGGGDGGAAGGASPEGGSAAPRLLFRATRELAADAAAMTAAAVEGEAGGMLQGSIASFIAGPVGSGAPADLASFYKRLAQARPEALPCELGLMRLALERPAHAAQANAPAAAEDNALPQQPGTGPSAGAEAVDADEQLWLVCNALGAGSARDIACKAWQQSGTKMVPWVGVAARLPVHGGVEAGGKDKAGVAIADGGGGCASAEGRAFCFLPLPLHTGLPVHVNGYFELSSNRRDIWYGGDMAGSGAQRSSWNVALLQDALAPCYCRLLREAASREGPTEQLYRLLPPLEHPEPWSHLTKALYANMADLPIIWTRASGGQWLKPAAALMSDEAVAASPSLRDLLMDTLGLPLAYGLPPAVEGALLRGTSGVRVVSPALVRQWLHKQAKGPMGVLMLTRKLLEAAKMLSTLAVTGLRERPQSDTPSAAKGGVTVSPLHELLSYCLADLDPLQSQQLLQLQQDLDGVPLLPLADGTLGRLQAVQGAAAAAVAQQQQHHARGKHGSAAPLWQPQPASPAAAAAAVSQLLEQGLMPYVLTKGEAELQLLAKVKGRCLSPGLPPSLEQSLQKLISCGLFNLVPLSCALLDQGLLQHMLPEEWQGAQDVTWPPHAAAPPAAAPAVAAPPGVGAAGVFAPASDAATPATQPPQQAAAPASALPAPAHAHFAEWLRQLWAWLAERDDVLQLSSWPLLPIHGKRLVRLQSPSQVLREGELTESVLSALRKCGCWLLDARQLPAPCKALDLVVQQPSLQGVLMALSAARAALQQEEEEGGRGLARSASGRPLQLIVPTQLQPQLARMQPRPPPGASAWAQRLSGLTAPERRQLRSFLLQARWFAGADGASAPLSQQQLEVLRSLPVYELYAGPQQPEHQAPSPTMPTPHGTQQPMPTPAAQPPPAAVTATPSAPATDPALLLFTSLDLATHRLAPAGTDPQVLTPAFIKSDSPAEEAILERHLGVPRVTLPALVAQHVGPASGRLPPSALLAFLSGVLRNLASLQAAQGAAALKAALCEHPLFASASGELRRPSELHDPRVAALVSLFPPDSSYLPGSALAAEPALLDALGMLGMHRQVTAPVLLAAATAIHKEHAQLLEQEAPQHQQQAGAGRAGAGAGTRQPGQAASSPQAEGAAAVADERPKPAREAKLVRRAEALLQQLDAWAQGQASHAQSDETRAAWTALSVLCWCPVVQRRPEQGLPWAASQPLLAPPRLVRPASEAWLVSATLHLLRAPPAAPSCPSAAMCRGLSWDAPPRISVVAAQLLQLGQMHPAAATWRSGGAAAAASADGDGNGSAAAGTPAPADEPAGQGAQDGAISAAIDLAHSPLGGQDACDAGEAGKGAGATGAGAPGPALSSALRSSLEGAAHRLYKVLTAALEGPEADLVAMSLERAETPVVWAGSGFVAAGSAALRSEGDFRPYLWGVPLPFHAYDRLLAVMGVRDRFTTQHYVAGLQAIAVAFGGQSLDDTALALALQLADCAADAQAHYGRPSGLLYLPDTASVMVPATELFFNDAEWLDTSALALVHPGLPQATAEALGVRSLRYAHEVEAQLTAALPCPSAAELRERLGPGGSAEAVQCFLDDLLELVDALGLRSVRVVLDARTHPAQSLLQPSLAPFQGPALCVVLPELVLGGEDLAALLCCRPPGAPTAAAAAAAGGPPPLVVRGRALSYSPTGLQSAFLVSELLQVISGSSTYLWDPRGGVLAQGAAELRAAAPKAKQYHHTTGDLLSTFADQFAVWSFADGLDISRHISATLLRLPLRAAPATAAGAGKAKQATAAAAGRAAAAVSATHLGGATLEAAERALAMFSEHAPRSLLFLQRLLGVEVSAIRHAPAPNPRHRTAPPAAGTTGLAAAAAAPADDPLTALAAVVAATAPEPAVASRELLLQATLVVLDPERPRPDHTAAAAARQRASVPAALGKALVQAFGRGRSAQEQRHVCPLEIHVMVSNALLLHQQTLHPGGQVPPDAAGEQQHQHQPRTSGGGAASSDASSSPSKTPQQGGAAASAGAVASLAAGLGSTVFRERWLLAHHHDANGVAPPAGFGASGRPELVAAVAACVARDDQKGLFPVSGLFAPVHLPTPPLPADRGAVPSSGGSGSSADAAAAAGSALGSLPFLVAGHFHLARGPTRAASTPASPHQQRTSASDPPPYAAKHILSPFAAAPTSPGGPGAGAQQQQQQGPGSPGGSTQPPASVLPPLVQHRCEHNRRVLEGVALAWQDLVTHLCSADYHGPREALYQLFPDMLAVAASGDEAASYCVRAMLVAASRLPLWRLRTARFVHLPEGCFLQPSGEGLSLGPAAMAFMMRQLPLFDVPWRVKLSLEAADVHSMRAVSPAVVRPLLKGLARRRSGGGHGRAPELVWPNLLALEATELLQFCCSDLAAPPPAAAGAAAGAAMAAAAPPPQPPAAAAEPLMPAGLAGMNSLIDGLAATVASQLRNVGEMVGPGLYERLRQEAGLAPEAAGAAAPPGGRPGGAPAPAAAAPHYLPAKLLDCKGLPVPMASGAILPLGNFALLVAPPSAEGGGPTNLLPPQCASEFLLPDCAAKLLPHLQDPQFRTSLALRLYTLADLARHLRTALPPGWDHPMPAAGASGRPTGQLGRGWDSSGSSDDGPSPWWLEQLWLLVDSVLHTAPAWQVTGPEVQLEALGDWPLLPVVGGALLPVRHRKLLFSLPLKADAAAQGKAAVAGSSGGAAGMGAPKPTDPPAADLRQLALPAPWDWLAPALKQVGCPLLDPRFGAACKQHCGEQPEGLSPTGQAAAARGAAVSALLDKMRLCDEALGGDVAGRCGGWDAETRGKFLGLVSESVPSGLEPPSLLLLRRLPIYPTHAGGHTALELFAGDAAPPPPPGEPTTLQPSACPSDLLNMVPGLAACLPRELLSRSLLVPQPSASRLFTLLDVPTLTPATFLAGVVLPHLAALSDTVRALVLTHIQTHWSRLKHEESLVDALRGTAFVLTADGQLRKPSELFDPDQTLFAAAFAGSPCFPAEQFAFPAWLALLRDCGLQAKVTKDAFMQAAQHVEQRALALGMVAPSVPATATTATATARGPTAAPSLPTPSAATGTSTGGAASGASPPPPPPPPPSDEDPSVLRSRLWDAAELLVQHVRSQAHTMVAGREWWASLGGVAFVPATLGLPGSPRARQVLARYPEAAAHQDWALIWSVLPIVATERQLPSGSMMRLRSPPPWAAVLQHLRTLGADGGEEALASWPAAAGMGVEAAARAVLQYIDREGVTPEKAAQLRDVSFVPVACGSVLVPPRRLFLRLKHELAPFAYELPASLMQLTGLLKSLGARDEPEAKDLVEALASLAAAAGGAPLNANQRQAVLRLLQHLAPHASTGGGAAGGAAAGGASVWRSASDVSYLQQARASKALMVLTADGRLVPAHTAVYMPAAGGRGGRLVGRIDPRALTLVHPALPEDVAVWLGCRQMGDVVEERLDTRAGLQEVEALQGTSLRDVRALLCSSAFISACHAVLRAHAPLVRGLLPPGPPQQLAAILRSAASRLAFVKTLRTSAVLKGTGRALVMTHGSQQGPGEDGGGQVYDYIEDGDRVAGQQGQGRIFVAEPPPHIPLPWLLAQVLSRVLGSPVTLPLQPLLLVDPSAGGSGAGPQAASLQPAMQMLLPGGLGYNPVLESAGQAGQPGMALLPADAALLQLKPLKRYNAGEVVAYRRQDVPGLSAGSQAAGAAAAAAAVAAERRAGGRPLQPDDAGAADAAAAGSSGFCYGIVAANSQPSDQVPVYRISLEVEPGQIKQLLSTQVYCFKSPTGQSASADMAPATAGDAVLPPTASSQQQQQAAATAAGGGAGAGAAQPVPATAADLGPVRPSEMVSAVRDVLAAAGLPLDPQAGELLGRVVALQEQLATTQGKLNEAKQSAAAGAASAEAARTAWQCKICFASDVDVAYTGCGHVICSSCASAARSDRCPLCRKASAKIKLYRA